MSIWNIIFLVFIIFVYGMMFRDVFGGGFDDSSRFKPPTPPPPPHPQEHLPIWKRKY